MITCLSPNGGIETRADGPIKRLMIATLRGVHTLERQGPGAPWEQAGASLTDRHISCLLYEPASGRLFAGAHGGGGLWTSEDQGGSWRQCSKGLDRPHIYTIAAQRRGDKVVLFAGTEPPALYRSDDLGESWRELPSIRDVPGTEHWTFPPPPHISHVKNIAFHPSEPTTLYVCVEQGALLRSLDDGATWKELTSYASDKDSFYHDVHRVAIAANNPRRIHLATGDGLYCSEDAGESWQHQQRRTDRVGYPDAMFLQPGDDKTIYLGGAGDAPETWRTEGGAHAGFIVSHDAGRTWTEVMDGLPVPIHGNIEAMAMHHSPAGTAFCAGTAVGDVFVSEDQGRDWKQIAAGLPPISKARHYRHFLSAEEKLRIEAEARAERV
jgi:photosystem II stability/assembly factor-like uncharacterized protein